MVFLVRATASKIFYAVLKPVPAVTAVVVVKESVTEVIAQISAAPEKVPILNWSLPPIGRLLSKVNKKLT